MKFERAFVLNFQEGVYVYGLYLEGAGWDKRKSILCESAKKVLFVMMPVIHVFALYDSPNKSPKLYQVLGLKKCYAFTSFFF